MTKRPTSPKRYRKYLRATIYYIMSENAATRILESQRLTKVRHWYGTLLYRHPVQFVDIPFNNTALLGLFVPVSMTNLPMFDPF
jgi:hypothetical protein